MRRNSDKPRKKDGILRGKDKRTDKRKKQKKK